MTLEELEGGTPAEQHPMAALLEKEAADYPEIRRGEIMEGVVVGTDRDGILVDIGAKSEGVVPPSEMHCLQPEGASKLNHGDKVLVFVIQPESQEGQIILSLDRARGERGWRVLQEYMDLNQAFEGYVTGANKGGLLVNVEGVNSFVPLSQLASGPERGSPENTQRLLGEWVGKSIMLKVIELNRRRNRAILSERAAMQERRAAEKERLLQELQEGEVRNGRITSIRDFGIFVDIGGADGLVHLSELSWERTPKSPHEFFKVGEEVPVFIMKVDNETKKIALSVRRAQPERWEEIVSNYREGQIVPGQVTKLAPFGAFVRLDGPIEGLIHISELVDRRINHPREVVDEDSVVPVKIVRIEYDRHRLGLSLRQARDKAEEDGWVFSESGGVVTAPQEVLDKLGVTALPASSEEQAPDQYAEEVEAVGEETEEPVTSDAEPEAIEEEPEIAESTTEAEPEAEESLETEEAPEAIAGESVFVQTEEAVTAPAQSEAIEEEPAVGGDAAATVEDATESGEADEEAVAEVEAETDVVAEERAVEGEVAEAATEIVAEDSAAKDSTMEASEVVIEVVSKEGDGEPAAKELTVVDTTAQEEASAKVEVEPKLHRGKKRKV